MDLNPFRLDIDDLINEFAECGSVTFAEFKRVWLSKKFSYIFEARPSTNQGFFMQSLYAHSLAYMMSTASFSSRLGGLYCLYCLYETQPFKPPFKIYLSLGELRKLKSFVIDAKQRHLYSVSNLVKHMLQKNVFLFGFVGAEEGSATTRVNELTDLQNAQVESAYKKLFADSRLEHFIHMDMNAELHVKLIKKRSSDYALAKELAINEASKAIDAGDLKRIAKNEAMIGDSMEKSAEDWNNQKELLYQQTGFFPVPITSLPHVESQNSRGEERGDVTERREDENGDEDEFERELEDALLFQSLECEEDQESEPFDADAFFEE